MDPIRLHPKKGPEALIQKRVMNQLRMDGWFVFHLHGNEYQSGLPDLFACNASYGSRWIEIKQPKGYKIKDTQHHTFLAFSKRNIGVWILTDSTRWEMNKLMAPPNWHTFTEVFKSNRASKPIGADKKPREQPDGPERRIQNAIKAKLEKDGWYCKDTHGNIYQNGVPDLYVCHEKYGARWIECKNPAGYSFTAAQLRTFPQMTAQGCGVWILTDTDQTPLLMKSANWYQYLSVMSS